MKRNITELDCQGGPLDGLLEIRIVKDDGGALSTKFEGYVFEIGCCGNLGDLASGEGAPRE